MEAEQFERMLAMIEQIGSGGNSWAFYLSAIAIIGAAIFAWFWQRGIARRTLTFQALEHQMWDQDFINQRGIFVGIRENHGSADLVDFAKPENDDNPEPQAIRIVLNNYELMCIGIKNGVLDEQMIKDYHRTTWTNDFDRMKPYIDAVRSNRVAKAYVVFEEYREKWRVK